jgi:hypothetical protein
MLQAGCISLSCAPGAKRLATRLQHYVLLHHFRQLNTFIEGGYVAGHDHPRMQRVNALDKTEPQSLQHSLVR